AYGTVSQLGFLMIANGLGTAAGAQAGLAMLLAHSLFKAPLFMVEGAIDKITGTRDLTKLSGLRKSHPGLFWTAILAALSMAGLPPMIGFIGKETVMQAATDWALWRTDGLLRGQPNFWGAAWSWAPLVIVVLGSILTVAYTARFMWAAFATKKIRSGGELQELPQTRALRGFGRLGLIPAAVLSAAGVVAAFVPGWVGALPYEFSHTFEHFEGEHVEPLALWHGFNLVLGLSAVIILVGIGLFGIRGHVSRVQAAVPTWLDMSRVYRFSLARLDDLAIWITGRTQRGDLSFYLYIILAVTVLAPLAILLFPTNSDDATISLPNV